ncbi:unnamed protein product [Periconia digitata]|uniref:WSC domain-containing protein n=1 Tax=Periconia digitata TaxID=1303443 RepID=A0A9W4UD62_9PLEO|nr:unnamed protein product [Periconia digitata]
MSFTRKALFGLFSFTGLVAATPEDKPPCPQDSYTPYVPFGCYEDNNPGRALPFGANLDYGSLTVEKCTASCKANGYQYAGLEYYGQCFCGATISSTRLSDAECSFPCNGDKNQTCGGFSRLSVWKDSTVKQNTALPIDYKSLGCWTEGTGGRALGENQANNVNGSELTTDKCLEACGEQGFAYAGTEWSQECYCGTKIDFDASQAPSTDCSFPCKGDSSETCGGTGRLNMYRAPGLNSPESCTSRSSVPSFSTPSSTPPSTRQVPPTSFATTSSFVPPSSTSISSFTPVSSTRPSSSIPEKSTSSSFFIPETSTSTPPFTPVSSTKPSSSTLEKSTSSSFFTPEQSTSAPPFTPVSSTKPPSSTFEKSTSPSFSVPRTSTSPPPFTSTPSSKTTLPPSTERTTFTSSTLTSTTSNTYKPPPCTPTKSSKQPPAPTPSCVCATPAPWAGKNCVKEIPLPCVGCNENERERPEYPWKLFNQKTWSQCRKYSQKSLPNACQDACKTQYTWCVNLAKEEREHSAYKKTKDLCEAQYKDCLKVNQEIPDTNWCFKDNGKNEREHQSKKWYDWLDDWNEHSCDEVPGFAGQSTAISTTKGKTPSSAQGATPTAAPEG